MVNEETIEKLIAMRMRGLAQAFREEIHSGDNELTFTERFGLLVDREWILRQERKQQRRLKEARLPQPAPVWKTSISKLPGDSIGPSYVHSPPVSGSGIIVISCYRTYRCRKKLYRLRPGK